MVKERASRVDNDRDDGQRRRHAPRRWVAPPTNRLFITAFVASLLLCVPFLTVQFDLASKAPGTTHRVEGVDPTRYGQPLSHAASPPPEGPSLTWGSFHTAHDRGAVVSTTRPGDGGGGGDGDASSVAGSPSHHQTQPRQQKQGAVPAEERRSSLQKWLYSSHVQQHAVPLHYIMATSTAAPLRSFDVAPATASATRVSNRSRRAHMLTSDGKEEDEEWSKQASSRASRVHGRYVVVPRHAVALLDGAARNGGSADVAPSHLSSQRTAHQLSAKGSSRAHPVEVHVIDEEYALVYLPASAVAAAAPVAQVAVLDVFATATGVGLKFARPLWQLLHSASVGSGTDDGEERVTASARSSPLTLVVSVWTAQGEASNVHKDLHASARVTTVAATDAAVVAGVAGCTVDQQVVPDTEDSLLRVNLTCRRRTGSAGVAERSASFTRWCLAVLRSVATHPSVRWLEETTRFAEVLNERAVVIVQAGHSGMVQPSIHALWEDRLDGSGEVVSIADSGLDHDSCFFRDPEEEVAMYPEMNPNHRKILSYYACNLTDQPPDAADVAGGHGTHVAGSIAGKALKSNKNMGRFNGVAPGAKLFLRDLGCVDVKDLMLPTNINDIFQPAYEAGARIASNSWGFRSAESYAAVEKLVDQYVYLHDDMLILFAAGNSPEKGLFSPGMAKNVLTVGAHANSLDATQQDTVGRHSAFGPTYDGRRKPDVVGPGEPEVISAYSDGRLNSKQCNVESKAGTSMATAIVAGGAALVRQYLRERANIAKPSAALLKACLLHSTAYLSAPETLHRSGFGRVDLSLIFATDNGVEGSVRPDPWLSDRLRLRHRETARFCFSVHTEAEINQLITKPDVVKEDEVMIKVTLSWTDVATALEGSMQSLVHDLDLVVVDALGRVYYADPAAPDTVAFDRKNNVEQVRIPVTDALARSFRVLVYGASITETTEQEYSVVVSAPGLRYHKDCNTALRVVEESTKTTVHCPNNCTGAARGKCDVASKTCVCDQSYRFVDCSFCDEEFLCNGMGTCNTADLTCRCRNPAHFADESCRVCAKNWYGPRCDSSCDCQHGGVCNFTSGGCRCRQDRHYGGGGCFDGARCEYCCNGFGGAGCNERSYWCDTKGSVVVVDDADGGYIQVNGYGVYPYSTTCRWSVQAPESYRVELQYLFYDIEKPFDSLTLFDPFNTTAPNHLVRKDMDVLTEPFSVLSVGNILELVFISDWADTRPGFTLRYRFVPTSRCPGVCTTPTYSSTAQNSAAVTTCAESIGLLDWCVCRPPYIGWHCEMDSRSIRTSDGDPSSNQSTTDTGDAAQAQSHGSTVSLAATATTTVTDPLFAANAAAYSVDAANAAEAGRRRPRRSFLVSEAQLQMNVAVRDEPEVNVEDSRTRLPLAVNGYSVLRITAHGGVRVAIPLALRLSFIPLSGQEWAGELPGLMLGVSTIDHLRENLLLSNASTPHLVSLYHCPNALMPTVTVTLTPVRRGATMGYEAEPQYDWERQLLVFLLWNTSVEIDNPQVRERVILDVVAQPRWVFQTVTGGGDDARDDDGWASDEVFLSCTETVNLAVGTGQALRVDAQQRPPHRSSQRYMTKKGFAAAVLGSMVVGLLMGAISHRVSRTFCGGKRYSGGGSQPYEMLATSRGMGVGLDGSALLSVSAPLRAVDVAVEMTSFSTPQSTTGGSSGKKSIPPSPVPRDAPPMAITTASPPFPGATFPPTMRLSTPLTRPTTTALGEGALGNGDIVALPVSDYATTTATTTTTTTTFAPLYGREMGGEDEEDALLSSSHPHPMNAMGLLPLMGTSSGTFHAEQPRPGLRGISLNTAAATIPGGAGNPRGEWSAPTSPGLRASFAAIANPFTSAAPSAPRTPLPTAAMDGSNGAVGGASMTRSMRARASASPIGRRSGGGGSRVLGSLDCGPKKLT